MDADWGEDIFCFGLWKGIEESDPRHQLGHTKKEMVKSSVRITTLLVENQNLSARRSIWGLPEEEVLYYHNTPFLRPLTGCQPTGQVTY